MHSNSSGGDKQTVKQKASSTNPLRKTMSFKVLYVFNISIVLAAWYRLTKSRQIADGAQLLSLLVTHISIGATSALPVFENKVTVKRETVVLGG